MLDLKIEIRKTSRNRRARCVEGLKVRFYAVFGGAGNRVIRDFGYRFK